MAKITRKEQKIFGSGAGATGITEYGTPAGGTPAYSIDLDTIQTADWLTGWSAAALSGTEIPTFQDFNAIHFVATNQIGYLLQEGIAEYLSTTEYHQNSIVKKTGTYELYGSKINTNTGNALPVAVDDANWKYLGDLSVIPVSSVIVQTVSATSASVVTGTAQIPNDDTIPQNTEGLEAITLAITPTNATNKLRIRAQINISTASSNDTKTAALFQDSTVNALHGVQGYSSVVGDGTSMFLEYEMVAGTTSPTTFKIRAASEGNVVVTLNGAGGTRRLGGILAHTIIIEEIKV